MTEQDFKFSYYNPPIKTVKPNGLISLFDCFRAITGEGENNNLNELTQELRSISDPDAKREFKGSKFTFVTFAGVFSPTRSKNNIQEPTGLFTIDIDHYGEAKVEDLKNRMSEDTELSPVLLFRSPSGDGLKVVNVIRGGIRNDTEYKRAYYAVERYIKERYDIDIDKNCKNIDRVCFLCYDPNAVMLQTGDGFNVDKWSPKPEPKKDTQDRTSVSRRESSVITDYDRALIAVEDIERSGIDITVNYTDDWFRIAGALSNLGERGRSLFHRVSRMNPSYTEKRTDEEFDKVMRRQNDPNVTSKTNIETLFHIARNYGVSLRSSGYRQETQERPTHPTPDRTSGTTPKVAQRAPEQAVSRDWNELLKGTTEQEMFDRESKLPVGLKTGYEVGENNSRQEIIIGGGYLTGVVAPTNHGKTIMLLNLLLNVAERYPDKRFLLLTYEENRDRITEYLLNVYLNDIDLKGYESNRRLIKEYFRTRGMTGNFDPKIVQKFTERKNELFAKYIETGRILIQYVDLDSDELCQSLRFLSGQIGGVFVDYFQCINPPTSLRFNSRHEALKQICFDLKNVSTETGLPVVLACQFNQEVLCPSDLLITKIGEAGDISRIMGELFGMWNLDKEVGRDMKPKQEAEYNTLSSQHETIKTQSQGRQGGMFVKVLKSRELRTGDYCILTLRGNTGKIYPNVKERPTSSHTQKSKQPTEGDLPF